MTKRVMPNYLHDLPHIREGLDHLLGRDRVFKKSGITLETFSWPYMRPGFAGLVRIVLGQQVSTASAQSMWRRYEEKLGRITPEKIMTLGDEDFKALGTTRQKTGYIRGLALAAVEKRLDLNKIGKLADDLVHDAITEHKGLGAWSAHMYLMFSLGRPDVWAPGDLGIREGLRRYLKLEVRPTEEETEAFGKRFAPHRTAASLLLWKMAA